MSTDLKILDLVFKVADISVCCFFYFILIQLI
jgi:hypothetical protein